MSDIINETKSRMQKSIESLSRELANISAGRANSNLLNGVTVDYYGAPTPVQQLSKHQCSRSTFTCYFSIRQNFCS